MKICSICEETKPVTDYYRQNGKLMKRCKACQCAYVRQWSQLQKEKMMQTRAKYDGSKYRTKKANTRKENHDEKTSTKGQVGKLPIPLQ